MQPGWVACNRGWVAYTGITWLKSRSEQFAAETQQWDEKHRWSSMHCCHGCIDAVKFCSYCAEPTRAEELTVFPSTTGTILTAPSMMFLFVPIWRVEMPANNYERWLSDLHLSTNWRYERASGVQKHTAAHHFKQSTSPRKNGWMAGYNFVKPKMITKERPRDRILCLSNASRYRG